MTASQFCNRKCFTLRRKKPVAFVLTTLLLVLLKGNL